jgi:hypothetical protein
LRVAPPPGNVVGLHRVGEVVATVDVAVEADDPLTLAEDVAGEVLSDLAGPVEVAAPITAGDVEIDVVVVDEVPDVAEVCEVAACVGVVVAETRLGDVEVSNGRARPTDGDLSPFSDA